MTTGTVLSVTHDGVDVTAKVRVTEADGLVDYTATLDYATWNALASNALKLAALVDAWNVVRDAALAVESGVTKVATWNDDAVSLT